MNFLLLTALVCFQAPAADDTAPTAASELKWGHSHLGGHYDEGPRQAPWVMEGIGEVHFPITSSHPEAQQWFEQGVALMHGFWYFEAERAFRWVAHLDPDCAMAYWGMSLANRRDQDRASSFLDQALERAENASPRERAYIELAASYRDAQDADEDERKDLEEAARVLGDELVMDHPDDLEALAFASLHEMEAASGEHRLAIEAMHQRILERDPDHVGALHYRIHNWDGKQGEYAIDSCMELTKAAPNCGHLQHMPGHVLSGIGMWHEAAIALDSATRVEQVYMNRRRVMPENNWNYMHNLDYLAYVQGQLGMQDTALVTAQQLIVIPVHALPDPDYAKMIEMLGDPMRQAVLRELLRGQRWQAVLDGDLLQWSEEPSPGESSQRHYAEAHAHLALGDLAAARESHEALEASSDSILELMSALPEGQGPPAEFREEMEASLRQPVVELDALLTLAEGEALEGIRMLTDYAAQQADSWRNDPPSAPFYGYNLLGQALLDLGSPTLAAEAFEKTLETVFLDGTALAGLVRAYHATGRNADAAHAMAALEAVWSEADADHEPLLAARALGVQPATGDLPEPFAQPMVQRQYREHILDAKGPCLYAPSPAPPLTAVDAEGQDVALTDYDGQSVLLIFYLGDQCTHCVEQLQAANERTERFAELNLQVLAVSKDSPEKNADVQEDFDFPLLSDPDFTTARRYGSFDDFEDVELHSTVLIDPQGRIHYITTGGEPFMDFDFLGAEAERLNAGGVIDTIRGATVMNAATQPDAETVSVK